jgi:hypothetical protein
VVLIHGRASEVRGLGSLHWIVEHAVHIVLVGAGVGWISVEHFSSDKYASGGVEVGKEILINMLSSINT